MKLVIHRGAKEIGGSCVELATDSARIIIDVGMPLVNADKQSFDAKNINSKSIEELKEKKVLPAIKGLYQNEKPQIDAVLISHSHQDHYGLLEYVNNDIPVYISRGAKELINATNIFLNKNIRLANAEIIKNQSAFNVGDFNITPYLVDHSAFDAYAFLIEAENKKVFYSGDFRGHGRKSGLFKKIIENPPTEINCLLMEGSMLGRNIMAFQNEEEIEAEIIEILKKQTNITFLFSSSQNIDRLVSVYRACLQTGTIFIIDIYTAYVLQKTKAVSQNIPQFDWENIRVKYFNCHAEKLAQAGYKELLYVYNKRKIEMNEINEKKNKILMLARDNSIFPHIVDSLNDLDGIKIIYSMWEGYLTDEFKNYCRDKTIDIQQVHTSGHAVIGDLQSFASALKPGYLVPIHTFKSAQYSAFFENVKIVEDGELFLI